MTSVLLYMWLAAAPSPGAVPPKATLATPQAPLPPAAPAVKGPPIPAIPELLVPGDPAPLPAGKLERNSFPADRSSDDLREGPTSKGESARSASRNRKSASASQQGRGVPNLPSLSTNALRNELRQSLAGPNEPGQVSERARLEQLAAEIAKAREALRQEIARLEDLIRQRGSCDGELRASAAASAATAGSQSANVQAAKDAEREQLESVSKTMKGMKPEQAAAVVTRLDQRLASEILRRMRPADAGAVLGLLRPELAAELATEIATRKPSFPMKKKAANP